MFPYGRRSSLAHQWIPRLGPVPATKYRINEYLPGEGMKKFCTISTNKYIPQIVSNFSYSRPYYDSKLWGFHIFYVWLQTHTPLLSCLLEFLNGLAWVTSTSSLAWVTSTSSSSKGMHSHCASSSKLILDGKRIEETKYLSL